MRYFCFTDGRWSLVSAVLFLLAFLPAHAWSDTPQPRIKRGQWASDLKVAPRMNAARKNLRGCEFVGQDLRSAVFDECDLHGVRFWDCDLSRASFQGADLTDVFFYECRELEGTDFTDAVIAGLRVDSVAYLSPRQLMSTRSYKSKDLRGCTITASVRRQPSAKPAYDFRKANLEDTTLVYGDFRGCDFTDARIDHIKMVGCRMTFEQLASTKNFKDRRLCYMNISTILEGEADFSGIDLTGTQLSIDGCPQPSFKDAIISECTLVAILGKEALYTTRNYQRGDLSRISFQHIDMSAWDFSQQNLTGCRFWGCTLTDANFEDAVITNVYFRHGSPKPTGLTVDQIKSTWNYKHNRMEGITLPDHIAKALQQEQQVDK